MKECQQCHQMFDPVNERPAHPAKYCSRSCRDEAQRTRVQLTCRQCGKQFRRKAYMAEWSQERGPFCGFACYAAWQKEHIRGEANPNFVPVSPKRISGQWMRNRQIVLERDGRKCQRCGSTHRLHVHHIRKWNPEDPSTHELGNLVTLCASCHRKVHARKQGDDGRFLSNP